MEPMRPLTRALTMALLVVLATSGVAIPSAGAHAELNPFETDAVPDAELGAGVDELRFTFVDLLEGGDNQIVILGPSGDDIVQGGPRLTGRQELTVDVEPLEVGTYEVQLLIASADGDIPLDRTYAFSVVPSEGGGFPIWLVWVGLLAVGAVLVLRPRRGARTTGE